MKKSKKFLFAGLFSALYLCMPSYGATETEDLSPPKSLIRLSASAKESEQKEGCWTTFKRHATSCLKHTKAAAQQVLPVLEFALPFIQDAELRKTIEGAIQTAKKGANLIQFNEDGSLNLPDGTELANTVLLVFSDKVTLFTEESKMFLPLIMSFLPETDYKTKMILTGYIATVDDPSTPYLLGFDNFNGKVQLRAEGTAFPVKAVSLFTEQMPETSQEKLKTYFSEYQEASKLRTEKEKETKKRATGTFLKPDSSILKDYNTLIENNPAFKLADVAEDILKGKASLVETIQNQAETIQQDNLPNSSHSSLNPIQEEDDTLLSPASVSSAPQAQTEEKESEIEPAPREEEEGSKALLLQNAHSSEV